MGRRTLLSPVSVSLSLCVSLPVSVSSSLSLPPVPVSPLSAEPQPPGPLHGTLGSSASAALSWTLFIPWSISSETWPWELAEGLEGRAGGLGRHKKPGWGGWGSVAWVAYHIPGMLGREGWPAVCPYLLAPLGCENQPGDHALAWRHCPLGDWQLDPEGLGSVSRVCRPGCHPVSSTSGGQGPWEVRVMVRGTPAPGPGQLILQLWMWGVHDLLWRAGLGECWTPDFSCSRSTSVQPSLAARGTPAGAELGESPPCRKEDSK